ncbi:OTU deubiquitinase with linear linkage specificity a isoform X2 [Syngnathoides biaculeatus]|uniref:OTU deubiquitinase with linear linkage specificity a isoform X2 n=1 Tax=Syngnathoides biaculeatus TaxID=300417 RepID=UPI002ADD8C04|nr:OTU deubiquitinase with linear linkage specificity a isoform X2 [Syngnathoides biaculeatus]
MSWFKAVSNGVDDVFEENADELDISSKEWTVNMKRRIRDGYVDGADAGEDAALEVGFKEGFQEGAAKTVAVGRLRGIRNWQLVPGGASGPALPRLRHGAPAAGFAARGVHRDGNHEGHGEAAPPQRGRRVGEHGGATGGGAGRVPAERLLHRGGANGHGFPAAFPDVAFGVRRRFRRSGPRDRLRRARPELQGHRDGTRAASEPFGPHQ